MKKRTRNIIFFLVSIALVWFLLAQVNLSELWNSLKGISPWVYVVALAAQIVNYIFKSLRFRILFSNKHPLKRCFDIVCMHNASVQLMPSNVGELSFVYLFSKLEKVPKTKSLATLIGARMIDLISIFIIFFISTLFVSQVFDIVYNVFLAAVIFLLCVLFLFSLKNYKKIIKNLVRFSELIRIYQFKATKKIIDKIDETLYHFTQIRPKRVIVYSFIVTFLNWAFIFFMNFVLIKMMGFDLTVSMVIIAGTVSMVAGFLPVHTAGGFGTFEAGWAGILVLIGVQKEIAILSGFLIHIVKFVVFIALGLYAMLILKKKLFS